MKTTIITPTIGTNKLVEAILSVQEQSVPCNHLIVVDSNEYREKVKKILKATSFKGQTIILPENTGGLWAGHRWNGHRIYAGIPAMVNTDNVSFLDEDNWFQPNFVEVMEGHMEDHFVLTCRRNIYSWQEDFIGVDNFESVGKTDFGYYLYDTNTYLFNTVAYNYYFARYFYYPLRADRRLSEAVIKSETPQKHIETPLVNYRAPKALTDFFQQNCTKP